MDIFPREMEEQMELRPLHFVFKITADKLSSINFHKLSKEGPYLDVHLGKINKETPVGQTFYVRPFKERRGNGIQLNINQCAPVTHFNNNQITDKIKFDGKIIITPFEHGCDKCGTHEQEVFIDMKIYNYTGLPLLAFHIHDGQRKNNLVSFGPISYFLYTSPEWEQYLSHYKDKKTGELVWPCWEEFWKGVEHKLPYNNINPKFPHIIRELSIMTDIFSGHPARFYNTHCSHKDIHQCKC